MSFIENDPATSLDGLAPEPLAKNPGSKREKDTDFLRTMRTRHDRGINREKENRDNAREDLNFKVGNQWPQTEINRRGQDRPALTFNKMLGFVRQVTGDVRQNKPAIKVSPNGDGADLLTAKVFAGLIRNIEQQSSASYVYANGADNSTSCGQGAWRITTQYTDDDSFEQDIRIKAIPNALSVVWDPDAIEIDKADARWCFIYSNMPVEEFKAEYPDALVSDFERKDTGNSELDYGDWFSREGTVRVAEYWCKEPVLRTICLLSDGRVISKDDYDPQKLAEVLQGEQIVRERTVRAHKVVQHLVSGAEELEEPTDWLTDEIPIIHVPGDEVWIDEKRVSFGLIRFAKDAQRAYNYTRSTSIEVTALQPKAPYELTPAMIAGYEPMWQNAGSTNYPYLLWNPDPQVPGQKPSRIQPPTQAAGLIQEAELASDDMKATTGLYDASLGAKSNETSGVAITKRQTEGDVSTSVFIDNLSMAIARTGRLLIQLIPKVYDTRRVLRTLEDDGSESQIIVNHVVQDGLGGSKVRHDPRDIGAQAQPGSQATGPQAPGKAKFYDLGIGKYDVTVSTGPSFTTRRQEASQGILELMRVAPMTAPILGPRLAKMQDWPQAEDVAADLEKLLPPQLQKPQLDANGQPVPVPQAPPPPPDPALLKMQAEMELKSQSAAQDQQIELQKLELSKAQSAAKAEAQQAEHNLAILEANHKADLAEREFQLKSYIAHEQVNLERETISAKIGMQQEAADREAILSGAPSIQDAQTQTQGAVQELGHMMHSFAAVHAAPTEVVKHPDTGETLGVQKQLPPELLAQLHPMVRPMAGFKPVVRDTTGGIVGLGDGPQPEPQPEPQPAPQPQKELTP